MFSTFSLDNPATWTGLIIPVLGAIAAVLLGFVIGRGAQHALVRLMPRTPTYLPMNRCHLIRRC